MLPVVQDVYIQCTIETNELYIVAHKTQLSHFN
jgi:hypothetical protein